MSNEKLFTIAEVARRLKVSRQTLYNWIEQGEIKTVSLNNGRQGISQSTLDYLTGVVTPPEQRERKPANYLLYDIVKVKKRHFPSAP